MRRAVLVLMVLLLAWSVGTARALTQITSLPFTASSAGETYYLAGDLSYSGTSNAITVSANNITIQGSGSGGTTSPDWKITHSGSSGDCINTGTTTGIVIRDIELLRTGAGDCIDEGAGSITLYRVRTFNSGSGGVNCLKTAGDATAESCIFARSVSGTVAVAATGTSKTRTFTNCTFYGVATAMLTVAATGITNATNCIFYEASSGSTVAVNDAGGVGTGTYSHNFYGKSTMATQHNIITANGTTYVDSGGGTNVTSLDANATTSASHPFLNADATSTANYRIFSTNTNCQNNGTNVNSYSTDIGDSTRVVSTTIDRGAHERQSAATPTGACCTPAVAGYGYGTCAITTEAACSGGGKVYEGDDTVCSPLPCAYVAHYDVTPGANILMDDTEAAAQLARCTDSGNPSYPYLNPLYTSLKNWIDGRDASIDNGDATDIAEMVSEAVLYRLTGTSTYLTKCKLEFSHLGTYAEGYDPGAPTRAVEGSVLSNQTAVGVAFALIQDDLTGPEKADWTARLLALNETVDAAPGEAIDPWRWHNTSILPAEIVLAAGLAGTHDQPKLDANADHLKTWCEACLEVFSPDGYFEDYSAQKGLSTAVVANGTQRTIPELSDVLDTHLDNGWQFWASRVRGEILDAGGTEGRLAIDRQAGKWDTTDLNFLTLFAFYSGPRQQPIAAAWLREIITQGAWDAVTSKDTASLIWPTILWGNPGLGTATLDDTPKIIYQPVQGVAYLRQGYAIGDNSNLAVNFFAFTTRFAAETAWGGITIRLGAANGNVRGGYRLIDYDRHYSPFHNRSIATSTILIYDAAEGIYTPQVYYIDQWKGAATDTGSDGDCTNNTYRTSTPPNDGGDDIYALDGSNPDFEAAAKLRVPECDYVTHPGYTIQGTVLALDMSDGLYFREVASGDSAYAATKQSGVKRSVTYLFDAHVLVVDEVQNVKASTPVITGWRFPRIVRFGVDDASITKIAGCDTIGVGVNDVTADPPGGRYSAAVTGNYLRTVNDGAQFIYTPLFQGTLANSSTTVLEVVGGPNRAGVHWRQDWSPNQTATYNPSNPSFEFDVNGDNYVPGNYACSDFPTTLPDGAYPVPAEGTRRITDYPPPGWNDDPEKSDGQEAGTWYGMMKTTPGSAHDTVLTVTDVWAADASIPQASRPLSAYAKRGGTIAVIYDADDDPSAQTLRLAVQRMPRFAGQRLASFSWTKPTAAFTTPASVRHFLFGAKPSTRYLIQVDSDGNGTFDVEAGIYVSDPEGVIVFSRGYLNYSAGRAIEQTDSPVTGACCFADGTCSIETPEDCDGASGSYFGDGTDCSPNPCAGSSRAGGQGDERGGAGLARTRVIGK